MEYNVNFEPDRILRMGKFILPQDTLENINNYNDEMTISQVVRFFERQGIDFTKTMIQNYVRVNVLPPPIEKRYYTKGHLILLTLINKFKGVYSLDDIRLLFRPILKNINTFEDDMIDMGTLYDAYYSLYKSTVDGLETQLRDMIGNIRQIVDKNGNVKPNEKETVYYFMTIMSLMLQSIAAKQFANILINDFNENNETSDSITQ